MTGSNAVYDQVTTDLSEMFAVIPHHGPERRGFLRLPYETEARGVLSDAREGIVRVQNISRVGLRIHAPCPLVAGVPVSISFGDVYLEGEPVTLGGRVIWARPHGEIHEAGVAIDHTSSVTLNAASEIFYAAMAGVSRRFEASYARTPRE